MANDVLLKIRNLSVGYKTEGKVAHAVNGIDLTVREGETLGLVGETGAGKTSTALAIMRLLPNMKRVSQLTADEITYKDMDLMTASEMQMQAIRGGEISMIFQDPMTSLNPVLSVGDQIAEAIEMHYKKYSKEQIDKEVDRILTMVGIQPERKNEYPHQFSGGMKQRVVIAIALSCNPALLLADEPTTALDVTIQAQVLDMISDLKDKLNTAMILITHDLGIVAQTCDTVAVMYAGEIIEYGTAKDIFDGELHHPYTVGLFNSIPDMEVKTERLAPIPGLMPNPYDLPKGCKFSPRCPFATDRCREEHPDVMDLDGHMIRCFTPAGKMGELKMGAEAAPAEVQ